MNPIDYSYLPEHMQAGTRRYVEKGVMPGSFLVAVLSNDLLEAYRRADDENRDQMANWARFLINQAPIGCHGSMPHVKDWCNRGGLEGMTS